MFCKKERAVWMRRKNGWEENMFLLHKPGKDRCIGGCVYTHGGQNTQVLEYVLKIDTDIGATLDPSGYPRMYVSVYIS